MGDKTERETRETLHKLGLIGMVILGVIGIGAGCQRELFPTNCIKSFTSLARTGA